LHAQWSPPRAFRQGGQGTLAGGAGDVSRPSTWAAAWQGATVQEGVSHGPHTAGSLRVVPSAPSAKGHAEDGTTQEGGLRPRLLCTGRSAGRQRLPADLGAPGLPET
jgi:hypothetical protein